MEYLYALAGLIGAACVFAVLKIMTGKRPGRQVTRLDL